ncbi:MAG: hypothetical protein IPK02_11250 [Candidatus Accumulibacter sp.]|uniref:Uncharacterized protein n=1 Tax=Candidatus Accumulibacter affinis TaxID=2954384 RepID=A0A935W7W3_9PROT|nr:hypothetical protein [Candidatus Accumulibacter affinis]
MTNIALAQVVRRVRPPVRAAEVPDFLAMIDQQTTMVVNLARLVGEVLQGKESTHSLRLLDLEQRREELQRRNQAAVHSLPDRHARLDEIHWTMSALDRAAAVLFQTARGFQQLRSTPDEAASQMMLVVQKAIESLQQGYAQLASGSPAAEFEADAAIGSESALSSYRSLGWPGSDAGQSLAASRNQAATPAERSFAGRWLDELYGNLNNIAHELAGAGAILKSWSRQLSAAAMARTLSPQKLLLS